MQFVSLTDTLLIPLLIIQFSPACLYLAVRSFSLFWHIIQLVPMRERRFLLLYLFIFLSVYSWYPLAGHGPVLCVCVLCVKFAECLKPVLHSNTIMFCNWYDKNLSPSINTGFWCISLIPNYIRSSLCLRYIYSEMEQKVRFIDSPVRFTCKSMIWP